MTDIPSNQRLTFNVNEYVRVRLTERGRECLRKNHAKLWADHGKPPAYQPPTESDGWSRWQLWELASEFGEHMYNGCAVPFETEIELERPVSETEVPHIMAAITRTDASADAHHRRDTGIVDIHGQRLLEGDRVRVEWTAELGVTELHCDAVGTVAYMPDKITAAWFVQFDTPFRRRIGPEGLYTSESQMLLQEREIGEECLIHFTRLPEKAGDNPYVVTEYQRGFDDGFQRAMSAQKTSVPRREPGMETPGHQAGCYYSKTSPCVCGLVGAGWDANGSES